MPAGETQIPSTPRTMYARTKRPMPWSMGEEAPGIPEAQNPMLAPPSIGSTTPVTKPPAGDAR